MPSEKTILQSNEDILLLTGPERYKMLMQIVSETKLLWIVESESSVLTLWNDEQVELLPVWPSKELAAKCLTKSEIDEGFSPVSRNLEQWLSKTTPAIIREGILVGAFPNLSRACAQIKPEIFAEHLRLTVPHFVLQSRDLTTLRQKIKRKSKD